MTRIEFLAQQKGLLKSEALTIKTEKNESKNRCREKRIQQPGDNFPNLLLMKRINNLRHITYSLIKNRRSARINGEMINRLKKEYSLWSWYLKYHSTGLEGIITFEKNTIHIRLDGEQTLEIKA